MSAGHGRTPPARRQWPRRSWARFDVGLSNFDIRTPRPRTAALRETRPFAAISHAEPRDFWGPIQPQDAEPNGRFPKRGAPFASLPAASVAPSALSVASPSAASLAVSTPAWAGTCLQPAARWGGGSDFRGSAQPRRSAWGAFRPGQFRETEQPQISEQTPISRSEQGTRPRGRTYSNTPSQKTEQGGMFDSRVQVTQELSKPPSEAPQKLSKGSRALLNEGSFSSALTSAGQLLDGADELVVGGMGVDRRRGDRLVPREPLRQTDVLGASVDRRTGAMTRTMKAEAPVEPRTLLPLVEGVAELARGESGPASADEDGIIALKGAALLSKLVEPVELRPHLLREHDLLGCWLGGAPLEDSQDDVSAGATISVEDVTNVEGEDLVLPQACGGGQADDDVVAPAVAVLPRGAEDCGKLLVGHGAWGTGDGLGVAGHGEPCGWRMCPYRLLFTPKARHIATYPEAA